LIDLDERYKEEIVINHFPASKILAGFIGLISLLFLGLGITFYFIDGRIINLYFGFAFFGLFITFLIIMILSQIQQISIGDLGITYKGHIVEDFIPWVRITDINKKNYWGHCVYNINYKDKSKPGTISAFSLGEEAGIKVISHLKEWRNLNPSFGDIITKEK